MSKDSPFHTANSINHPLTKQLLDYNEPRRGSDLSKVKHPKMFINIMRQGKSREVQDRESAHYNVGL